MENAPLQPSEGTCNFYFERFVDVIRIQVYKDASLTRSTYVDGNALLQVLSLELPTSTLKGLRTDLTITREGEKFITFDFGDEAYKMPAEIIPAIAERLRSDPNG